VCKTDEFAPSSGLTVPLVIAASIVNTPTATAPLPPWDEVSYLPLDQSISQSVSQSVKTNARSTGEGLMSRKQPGNDFVKRWVLSRRSNVNSDSTDVASSGRSFQICEVRTDNWKSSAAEGW